MKAVYFFIIATLLFISCTSSQNLVSREAAQKVNAIKNSIPLTNKQAKKLTAIETEFLSKKRELESHDLSSLSIKELQEKRINKIKALLSRDQYIKFDMIENKRLKPSPVRAN